MGLISNVLTIVVLWSRSMRSHSFNQLLIALAVCDLVFICVSVPVYSFAIFGWLPDGKVSFVQKFHLYITQNLVNCVLEDFI